RGYDSQLVAKSGKQIPVEMAITPLTYHGQEAVLGAVRDITERKQAEEALRQLNQAMEQSPVSVMITDTEGTIQYVNPKFSQVTGYSAAETMGQNARLLQSGEHPPQFYRDLWNTITAGQEWQGVFHNRKQNGQLFWSQASIAGVKDQSGEITHYVTVSEDITQRKQREEEHVRQERLAAVGQLAAGIAHDFNNVMAVITLYSDLLERSANLSKKDLEKVQTIHQQARHAADLTRQILDFSRRSVREPRPLDLKLLLNEMLKFIERTIPERVQMQFAFSKGDYMVNADPTQLQQVVTNLTVNARDAMPQGGSLHINLSRLTLGAGETPPDPDMEPGEWLRLAVADTGDGITPEVLPHIFEPFFTTKEVGKGTGLGLAQVYGIVRQHEGYITVDSRLGEGATFAIYLPALAGEDNVETAEPLTVLSQGQGETVLLVEDSQILLDAVRSVLASLNYQVIAAINGAEALNIYRTQSKQISLVLTDVVMPQMDGFELVKALQQYSPPPKVLMMSGFPRDTDMPPEMQQLISGWLRKPLNIDQLARMLREVLP
ncbi:MAG: PAS domain S-box protein, partial [Anaerolineae bacterium]